MTIASGENLKGVQEMLLPGDVVALNIFYWKAQFQAPQQEADVVDKMVEVMEAVYGSLTDEIVSGAVLGDMHGYVRDGLVWTLIGTGAPDVTFLNITEMLPQGVAALMRAYTERPRTIGRKYIPGFAENAQASGVLGAGAVTALGVAAVQWGNTWQLSPDNRILGGVWSTTQSDVMLMNDVYVIPVNPGYQRRRRPGVGI